MSGTGSGWPIAGRRRRGRKRRPAEYETASCLGVYETFDERGIGKFHQFDDLSILKPDFIDQLCRDDNVPGGEAHLDPGMNHDAVAIGHHVKDITFHKLEGRNEISHCSPNALM